MQRHLALDCPEFQFDPEYVKHVERYNGGKPITRYFQTARGLWSPIDRFLNFSDRDLIRDRDLTSLNANVMWSAIEDRLTTYQFPFAILPTGDFLCFDYEKGFPPRIVLWYHEGSTEGQPLTEDIALNFREFIENLSESDPG